MKKVNGVIIAVILVIVGLGEYGLRESRVRAKFRQLSNEKVDTKKQVVQDLVAGCFERQKYSFLPHHLTEILWGLCRPLRQAPLAQMDLSDVDLRGADLSNLDLNRINLKGSQLTGANFDGTNLSHANLSFADLIEATFREADLSYASLNFSIFRDAILHNANFSNADLLDANFWKADLDDVTFNNASLERVSFIGADLSNVDFSNATLREGNFGGATVGGVDLRNTVLLSTLLRPTESLSQQQLEDENRPFICNTAMPKNIDLEGGEYRDCERLPEVLQQRYPNEFENIDVAGEYVSQLICDSFVSRNVEMNEDHNRTCNG